MTFVHDDADFDALLQIVAEMFWGPRLSVEQACADVRAWLADELGPR